MTEKASGITVGRLALGGAAVLALGAIGLKTWHGRERAPAPSAAEGSAPDVGQMVKGLEVKLRANPNDGAGWRMLGLSYFNLNRFADSARAYARAAAIEPNHAEDWSALGEALVYAHKAGVDADAAHAFQRALEIDPKDARARYFLGVRKDMAGDHKGAIEDWIALLKDTPPGAPWEQSVRTLVQQVAAREKIDIAGRLPAPAPSSAADVATDAIPGPSREQMADAARLSPTEQNAMAREMVDRLAARLASDPRDADGWIRLMRARLVLEDRAGAKQAYAQAWRVFATDPATLGRIEQAKAVLGL